MSACTVLLLQPFYELIDFLKRMLTPELSGVLQGVRREEVPREKVKFDNLFLM